MSYPKKKVRTLYQRKIAAKKDLQNFIDNCGGKASKRWKVSVRYSEVSKRYRLSYIFGKKRFNSKLEAARYLGLNPNKKEKNVTKKSKNRRSSIISKKENHKAFANIKNSASKRGVKKEKKSFDDDEIGNRPSVTPVKPMKLVSWQVKKVEDASPNLRTNVRNYLDTGYTIIPNVLAPTEVSTLLNGPECSREVVTSGSMLNLNAPNHRMTMRKRKANQEWLGAIKTINACIKQDGHTETVLCPLTTRAPGRYDMPLPTHIRESIINTLSNKQVVDFIKFLCPRGKWRTHDILLSKPASSRQVVHTDSSWEGKRKRNPPIHYITILIPLTVQDKVTGGTRVWPRSHRDKNADVSSTNYIDTIEPLLKIGDALVFDGLLSHCGMENNSGILDGVPRDRYFYYGAFATGHDPNTDVTGS